MLRRLPHECPAPAIARRCLALRGASKRWIGSFVVDLRACSGSVAVASPARGTGSAATPSGSCASRWEGARRASFQPTMSPTAFELFAVSAVTMGISHTIAKERIFAPLRAKLSGDKTWLGYLVSCPYCSSHYVAFVLVPLTGAYAIRTRLHGGLVATILDWFLSSIFVTVIAAFLRIGFYFVDESQGLIRREQKRVATETERREER
ncbi:Hypothetical protein A7982_06217 [Minicystis rosea]|nr:Hypothetical protein A7982_06217 [Minicystis rosea]